MSSFILLIFNQSVVPKLEMINQVQVSLVCIYHGTFMPHIQSGTLLKNEKIAPAKDINHTYFWVGRMLFRA